MIGRLWWRVRFVIRYLYVISLEKAWKESYKWSRPNNDYYTRTYTPSEAVEDIRKFQANFKEVIREEEENSE